MRTVLLIFGICGFLGSLSLSIYSGCECSDEQRQIVLDAYMASSQENYRTFSMFIEDGRISMAEYDYLVRWEIIDVER